MKYSETFPSFYTNDLADETSLSTARIKMLVKQRYSLNFLNSRFFSISDAIHSSVSPSQQPTRASVTNQFGVQGVNIHQAWLLIKSCHSVNISCDKRKHHFVLVILPSSIPLSPLLLNRPLS